MEGKREQPLTDQQSCCGNCAWAEPTTYVRAGIRVVRCGAHGGSFGTNGVCGDWEARADDGQG